MITNQHWTQNLGDFSYWVLSDFTAQIEVRMEDKGVSHSTLAEMVNVSPSRVSQVLNDPGNLTVGNVVKYTRALGMKVALVAYDDSDPDNNKGPINADVFTECWKRMGRPQDFFDLGDMTQLRGCWVLTRNSASNDPKDKRDMKKVESTAATNSYAAHATGYGERRQSA